MSDARFEKFYELKKRKEIAIAQYETDAIWRKSRSSLAIFWDTHCSKTANDERLKNSILKNVDHFFSKNVLMFACFQKNKTFSNHQPTIVHVNIVSSTIFTLKFLFDWTPRCRIFGKKIPIRSYRSTVPLFTRQVTGRAPEKN